MQIHASKTGFPKVIGGLSRESQLILLLAAFKLIIHLLSFSNFGLHRDAYLYYAQSEHLAWGYFSVPPLIAVFGKVGTLLFGNTTFALRFFPMVIGALNVVLVGFSVKELGGKRMAIALACMAYILSPAFLHSNSLFQPVTFNQFFWLLSSFLILRLIHRNDPKYWIWIGVAFGFGFLNKYSVVFFYAAFALALLLSKHRRLIWTRSFSIAAALALVIIAPNIFWQYQNHWPVLHHMAELREQQLVNVNRADFLVDQLMMNLQAVLLWLPAVWVLLFVPRERNYRLFGFIFVFILLLLLLGSGKSYYTLGIYPILFAFGAFFFEKYIRRFYLPVAGLLLGWMLLVLYGWTERGSIPFSNFEKASKKEAYRWEDGQYHDLPQDMADMTGWEELGEQVANIYTNLEDADKQSCLVFCDNYGQAGAVMFYGKKYGVPQPASLNDSFLFWSPDELHSNYVIWVHSSTSSGINPDTFLPEHFEDVQLKYTLQNPYFRENGSRIYLCKNPTEELNQLYKKRLAEERGEPEN